MIDETLRTVSANCLGGRPVPAAFAALWEAQLAGRSPIEAVEFGAVELVSSHDDEFFEGCDPETCGAAVARAYARMFRQVAFIGREADGSLIGSWLRDERAPIDGAPIVVLDSEGQFDCTAATLPDHFVQAAGDDARAVAAIRRWFRRRGIATSPSPDAAWAAIEKLPDPNKLSHRYQQEEAAADE